jgi:hypothetical protein
MLIRKIAWQKYEDVIEGQINSPIIDMISKSVANQTLEPLLDPEDLPTHYGDEQEELKAQDYSQQLVVSLSDEMTNEAHLMSNFDCWMGHANFNLTNDIKKQLSCQDGVEILKVCSRYRFFVGVGKMFNFRDVRQGIEKTLLGKEADERKNN